MMEKHYRKLSILKIMFPQFEDKLEIIYWKDAVFREVAREYMECINKQQMILAKTGKKSDMYADTINELKVELLSLLDNVDSTNKDKKD